MKDWYCTALLTKSRRDQRLFAITLVAMGLLCLVAFGQEDRRAIIEGVVRDAHGTAISSASVSLLSENDYVLQTVSTEANGAYRLVKLNPGRYRLRATMSGYDKSEVVALAAAQREIKDTDIVLVRTQAPALPDFSDEPNFTVAGVADATNLGGHGSDVVVRNREGLAKAAVSMGTNSPEVSSTKASFATANELRAALVRDPNDYEANYLLGKILLEEGEARESILHLERASRAKPGMYGNEYELALAYFAARDYEISGAKTRALLAGQQKAELHHLLGEIEEKRNDPLDAVREYQLAAELEPSEPNVFDWGAELLLHQAPEPAIEVFSKGARSYPASMRMVSALGVALYAHGEVDKAIESLCRASDLDVNSTPPYLFLGRILSAEAAGNAEIDARLLRFSRLQPENALANLYYAVSLWKLRTNSADGRNLEEIESRLKAAVRIDPALGPAYLQLGILYSEQKNLPAATAAFEKAVKILPELPDAHYRLAQAYRQAGDKTRARLELEAYEETSRQAAKQVERERHEVRQFVYTMRNQIPAQHPNN